MNEYLSVVDNADRSRFELRIRGELAGLLGYVEPDQPGGSEMEFLHAIISEEFERRGFAAVMVREALELARGYGWKVRPICTYVQWFLAGHPDFDDVVVAGCRRSVA